jgi:hypothetical protein
MKFLKSPYTTAFLALGVIIGAILLLSGCTTTEIEAGVGIYTTANNMDTGDNVACHLNLRQNFNGGWYLEYAHDSICTSGAPFNNRVESSSDVIRMGKVWVIRGEE